MPIFFLYYYLLQYEIDQELLPMSTLMVYYKLLLVDCHDSSLDIIE